LTLLSGLTNLFYLDLSRNKITDVSPLSGLTNLQVLWLAFNEITDITPLHQLENLYTLILRENPISEEQIEALQKALPDLEIFNKT
jgi:internalin A